MRFDVEELFETASMTLHQNLDIRTTTLGVNLKDCIDSDFAVFQDKVYRRVNRYARALIEHAAAGGQIRHPHCQQADLDHARQPDYGDARHAAEVPGDGANARPGRT